MAAQGCTRLVIQQVGLASKLNALICAPNVFSVSLHLVSAITGDHPYVKCSSLKEAKPSRERNIAGLVLFRIQ